MEPPSEPVDPTAGQAAPSGAGRLWNRNFLLLWQGQTISQFGNLAFSFAMMLWLKDATGSATLMGTMMFAAMSPGVLLGPFGGTFADRHSRIRIAVICDLLSGVAVIVLALMMFNPRVAQLDPLAVHTVIATMIVVSVLTGILRAFFTPALSAVIPDLVPVDKIPAANSLNQLAVQGSTMIGQVIGGVLYQVLGAPLLFLIDGTSYLYAALCALFIRVPKKPETRSPESAAGGHPFHTFLRETGEGFLYIWKQAGLRDFMVIASVVNFFSMPIVVLMPFYVELYLGQDAKWYGFLLAGVGAGSVVGYILAGVLNLKGRARQRGVVLSMILVPVSFLFLGLVRNPYVALAMVTGGGVVLGIVNVYLMTMIQVATPDEVRGRVMGVILTLSAGLTPAGMVLGGVVGDLTGKNIPLIYSVCAGATFLVTLTLSTRRDLRDFLTNG